MKCPHQIIPTNLIDKARAALYTVTNKLLFKLVCKLGGEPWALDELPYFYLTSIAIGIHVSKTHIALVASMN